MEWLIAIEYCSAFTIINIYRQITLIISNFKFHNTEFKENINNLKILNFDP